MTEIVYNGIKYYPIEGTENEVKVGNGGQEYHTACDVCPRDIIIPSSFIENGKELIVTRISQNAFYYCKGIRNVFIPKTITFIDQSALQSVDASSYYFEQGSKLKEIGPYGIGWPSSKSFVLPPSVEKLTEGSLRGFDNVRDFYYCGTKTFDGINVFTSRTDNFKSRLRVHVTPYFNSSKKIEATHCMLNS